MKLDMWVYKKQSVFNKKLNTWNWSPGQECVYIISVEMWSKNEAIFSTNAFKFFHRMPGIHNC